MRQTLLGVASFHRACLLAQDFTHEPACQTGERAPQGRFRHQPEQIVLAACLLSIPACLRRGGPVLSLTGLRHPTDYSPEIKARQALFAFLSVYPKEVALVGGQQCRITGKFSYVAMVPRRAHTMELWNMKTYLCFMKKGHLSLYSFLSQIIPFY